MPGLHLHLLELDLRCRQHNLLHHPKIEEVNHTQIPYNGPCSILSATLPLLDWFRASLRCRETPMLLPNGSIFWYSPPESLRSTCTRQSKFFSKIPKTIKLLRNSVFSTRKNNAIIVNTMINKVDHIAVLQMSLRSHWAFKVGANDSSNPVDRRLPPDIALGLSIFGLPSSRTSQAIYATPVRQKVSHDGSRAKR